MSEAYGLKRPRPAADADEYSNHSGAGSGSDNDDPDALEELPPELAAQLTSALVRDLAVTRNATQEQRSRTGPTLNTKQGVAGFPTLADFDFSGAPTDTAPLVHPQLDSSGEAVDKSSCRICGEKAKYTCPGCFQRTCSLECVKAHKVQTGCSGARDFEKRIPLSEFSDRELKQDFHFIEDTMRVVDNCRRHFQYDKFRFSFRTLPPPLHALREAAKKHGVLCQIISEGMSKRDANTSRFDRKSDTITWRAEFRFFLTAEDLADAAPAFVVATDWASERYKLNELVPKLYIVNPRPSEMTAYPIRRGYSNASKWVTGGFAEALRHQTAENADVSDPESISDISDKDEVADANEGDEKPQMEETVVSTASAKSVEAEGPPVPTAEVNATPAQGLEAKTLIDVRDSQLTAHRQRRCLDSFSEIESAVQRYLQRVKGEYILLSKAERVPTGGQGQQQQPVTDTVRWYFKVDATQTLHEALRQIFFLVEFPVFLVLPYSEWDALTAMEGIRIITETERMAIRESFRKKPKPERPSRLENMAPQSQTLPCRSFARGSCSRGDACPYQHIEGKDIPACRSMVRDGECNRGLRCSFNHDPAVIAAAQAVDALRNEEMYRKRGRGQFQSRGPQPSGPWRPPRCDA